MSVKPLRIALVVGELSGEVFATALMAAVKKRNVPVHFFGVGSDAMVACGFEQLWSSSQLAVVALDALGSIFSLWLMRARLYRRLVADPPDLFVGIDAPDFNFHLEAKLRKKGVRVVHMISPSIWAWRAWRLPFIKKAVDHMVVLFPFEKKIYQRAGIPVTYIAHPVFSAIPLEDQQEKCRALLAISSHKTVVALLPGSRLREVERCADILLGSATLLQQRNHDIEFLMPVATAEALQICKKKVSTYSPHLQQAVRLVWGHAQEVMAAANLVILSSGTATLECATLKRPMIVIYRLTRTSHFILKRLLYIPWVSLPNVFAQDFIVPEIIGPHLNTQIIAEIASAYLAHPRLMHRIRHYFYQWHRSLLTSENFFDQAALLVLQQASLSTLG